MTVTLCLALRIASGASPIATASEAMDPSVAVTSSSAAEPAGVSAAPIRSWSLRLPKQDRVLFRGVANNDSAGVDGKALMYYGVPAAGLIGLIATGIYSASAQNSQLDRLQSEADVALEPFAPVLGKFTYRELMEPGLAKARLDGPSRVTGADESSATEWIIESAPVFAMTQDRSALILDNLIRFYEPGAKVPAFAQTVRIVSTPLALPAREVGAPEPASPWMAEEGRRLIDASVALFAESLELAMEDSRLPRASSNEPVSHSSYRNVRYRQGAIERIERAQVLQQHCRRALLRTLRGWVMSVPLAPSAASAACDPSN